MNKPISGSFPNNRFVTIQSQEVDQSMPGAFGSLMHQGRRAIYRGMSRACRRWGVSAIRSIEWDEIARILAYELMPKSDDVEALKLLNEDYQSSLRVNPCLNYLCPYDEVCDEEGEAKLERLEKLGLLDAYSIHLNLTQQLADYLRPGEEGCRSFVESDLPMDPLQLAVRLTADGPVLVSAVPIGEVGDHLDEMVEKYVDESYKWDVNYMMQQHDQEK